MRKLRMKIVLQSGNVCRETRDRMLRYNGIAVGRQHSEYMHKGILRYSVLSILPIIRFYMYISIYFSLFIYVFHFFQRFFAIWNTQCRYLQVMSTNRSYDHTYRLCRHILVKLSIYNSYFNLSFSHFLHYFHVTFMFFFIFQCLIQFGFHVGQVMFHPSYVQSFVTS